ncbi:MAG: hypothetical protein AB1689_03440 [Thermodesulfobacteriota bacterium]
MGTTPRVLPQRRLIALSLAASALLMAAAGVSFAGVPGERALALPFLALAAADVGLAARFARAR